MKLPTPNEIYRHYKGENYKTVCVSKLESNPEQILVSYTPLYETEGEIKAWTRPVENFFEEIEVNGKLVPRFKLIK